MVTKVAAREKSQPRQDSPAGLALDMNPKGPPPRLLSEARNPPAAAPPLHPSAKATIDSLNQSLHIQQIPIPQYKFETYVDWSQLDRSRYDSEKMEDAFNFRFRGCKDRTMPHDHRGTTAKVWQAIVDKVANVFGKSDAFIDQYDTYCTKFQKELSDGVQSLPIEHSWCEALALVHSNQLVLLI